ncbi:histone H1.10 [Esox lucius]|uniref:H1.10 linker histone n=1 Tax=Esox lucius TaxID=8010 RepID=A0AAY5K6U8_ESOLU|nr:histone H1.10 [Esox lucius]
MVKSEVETTATLANRSSPAKKKKNKKKKNKPGKYSVLVIDAVKTLNERNGSSLVKIYNEAKKASWFDEQNGRTYLRYSIRALVLNNTLIQVKGMGANGSFKLNKDKFTKGTQKKTLSTPGKITKKTVKSPTKKKPTVAKPKAKSSPLKAPAKKTATKKTTSKPKNLGAKKVSTAPKSKTPRTQRTTKTQRKK